MGKAPEVKAALLKAREQEWVLDPATGQIIPEVLPEEEQAVRAQPRPAPVQSASYTYD